MKRIVYFIACCLCFGSAFGAKASNCLDNSLVLSAISDDLERELFFSQCHFISDPFVFFIDFPADWSAGDTTASQAEFPNVCLSLDAVSSDGIALIQIAVYPNQAVADEMVAVLARTVCPSAKLSKNGFEDLSGKNWVSYRAYGAYHVSIFYTARNGTNNKADVWEQLKEVIRVKSLSSFE